MAMPYTTGFVLRVYAAGGTNPVYAFSPKATVGKHVQHDNPEPVYIDRELITMAPAPYMVGFIGHWTATFEAHGTGYIPGAAGYQSLETVLNSAAAAGAFLRLSLDGQVTWKNVYLDGAPTKEKLADKNVGVRVEISLREMAVDNTAPYRLSA